MHRVGREGKGEGEVGGGGTVIFTQQGGEPNILTVIWSVFEVVGACPADQNCVHDITVCQTGNYTVRACVHAKLASIIRICRSPQRMFPTPVTGTIRAKNQIAWSLDY